MRMPHQDTTLTPKQVAGNAAEDLACTYLERRADQCSVLKYAIKLIDIQIKV
mgnify:CR=1 FL=1